MDIAAALPMTICEVGVEEERITITEARVTGRQVVDHDRDVL
jgi:hypothetical protein